VKWTRRHRAVTVSAIVVLAMALVGLTTSTLLIAAAQARTKDALDRERDRTAEATAQRALADKRYHQARDAVDFFTRVAAEELADNMQAAGVRKEMLEAALGYYQGLLEGGGDPSTSAELAAAQAKVTEIVTELSAFLRFVHAMSLSELLSESSVQADLGLSRDEARAAQTGVRESMRDPVDGSMFPKFSDMTPEQKREHFTRRAAAAEAALDELLTPARATRLRQIERQVKGPMAFGDPDVAERLALTRAQRDALKSTQASFREALGELFRPPEPTGKPGPGPARWDFGWLEERMKEATALRKAAVASFVTRLSPPQAAAWEAMAGAPFDGNVFQPPFGFGRGRFLMREDRGPRGGDDDRGRGDDRGPGRGGDRGPPPWDRDRGDRKGPPSKPDGGVH
jgi:hypothetical protein